MTQGEFPIKNQRIMPQKKINMKSIAVSEIIPNFVASSNQKEK